MVGRASLADPARDITIGARRLFDGVARSPLEDVAVRIEGGRIRSIAPLTGNPSQIAFRADIVCPGFVDLQINGANDVQFNDTPSAEGIVAIVEGARQGGTAHILPTFITDADSRYRAAVAAVREARALGVPGVLGIHLEGPFLSPDRPGIHPPDCIRPMEEDDIAFLCAADCGALLLTLAPERAPEGAIRRLAEAGVTVFGGHTAADFDEITRACNEGLRGATHLFNAMSQLGSRSPGVVGAVLQSEDLFAGIIADGIHVHFANLALAHRLLADRLCLVTDAMLTLAGTTTAFRIGEKLIHRDGKQLSDANGTLAGAHLALDEAVRNATVHAGFPLADALYAASVNPLRALGLESGLGHVAPGRDASLTMLNDKLSAVGVYADGRLSDLGGV